MKTLLYSILFVCLAGLLSCSGQKEYNILDYQATGDGATLNTAYIQKAIDECHQNGGGKVIIPKGTFLTGTLYMKDNTHLYLEEGAILKGSDSFDDYPDNAVHYVNSFSYPNGKLFENKALIFAEGVRNISITGKGMIDGNGDSPTFRLGNDDTPQSRKHPCMLLFVQCNRINIHDLTLVNSAYWLQNYLGCDTVHLKGLTIFNHSNFNQDATDIDSSNVF
ncbi:MAG: hypothetical protein LIP01_13295 [Tannerellaceae bacterium]|nr:hypothetical protein [Tannerellaceae bacterium]